MKGFSGNVVGLWLFIGWLLAVGCWLLVKSQVLKAKSFSTKFLPEPVLSAYFIMVLKMVLYFLHNTKLNK